MDWGRSRSGCFFCFYQQKIEWVRLLETHPHLYALAQGYEEKTVEFGEQFYWNKNETLRELAQPERVADIKAKHEANIAKAKARRHNAPLVQTLAAWNPRIRRT